MRVIERAVAGGPPDMFLRGGHDEAKKTGAGSEGGADAGHLSATSQIFSRRDFPAGPSTSRVTVKSPPRAY